MAAGCKSIQCCLPCSNISTWHLNQSFGYINEAMFAGKMERSVAIIIYTFQKTTHICYLMPFAIFHTVLPVMLKLNDNTKILW